MQFENTIETQITEHIMRSFSKFSKEPIIVLETREYNKVFSLIHKTLSGFGLNERLREEYDAVNKYQSRIRDRYKDGVKSVISKFRNGLFSKNKHGELVGISVLLKKLVREAMERERMEAAELLNDIQTKLAIDGKLDEGTHERISKFIEE